MTTYTLEDPFEIDDGSLDTVDVKLAFVLGVEWSMIREALKARKPLNMLPVHEENVSRVSRLLKKYGYSYTLRPVAVDPGWYELAASWVDHGREERP